MRSPLSTGGLRLLAILIAESGAAATPSVAKQTSRALDDYVLTLPPVYSAGLPVNPARACGPREPRYRCKLIPLRPLYEEPPRSISLPFASARPSFYLSSSRALSLAASGGPLTPRAGFAFYSFDTVQRSITHAIGLIPRCGSARSRTAILL